MAGQAWTRRVLTSARTAPRRISLHSAEPGERGAHRLAGPSTLNVASFSIEAAALINARDIEAGPLERAGRVRYIALWTLDGLFITSLALERPEDVRAGQMVRIPRRALRLDLR